MEVFNTLMMIFIMLIIVNIILTFSLWRSTDSKNFGVLVLHWIFLLIAFSIQREVAQKEPVIRCLIVLWPNFILHYTLLWVFASMVNIPFPFKKCILIPISIAPVILILHFLKAEPHIIYLPLVIGHSSMYFYCSYKAFRYHRSAMTFSLKAIGILFIIYGFHLYTYPFFSANLERLALGFAIAIAILMAISILFPAAITEMMTQENVRLKAEMEFKAKLTQSAKMAALGEMAGGVAHEMNNPLTILSLTLDRAKQSLRKNDLENLFNMIDKSRSTVDRMSKIVRGLLTFSREDSGTEFKEVCAQKIVQETLILCSERMKKHDIKLIVSMPEEEVFFVGNSVQISQVLLNLLNNSHDAIENLNDRWIKLEVRNLKKFVEFSVTDSGLGIDKETKDKMFQPFFTTKEVGKGTGLGLSIARGIIENHQGTLKIDSASINTRIYFCIPK